jgi:hypothetical protein
MGACRAGPALFQSPPAPALHSVHWVASWCSIVPFLQTVALRAAGYCDEDIAACFCPSNTTYGRIPAAVDAPLGAPQGSWAASLGWDGLLRCFRRACPPMHVLVCPRLYRLYAGPDPCYRCPPAPPGACAGSPPQQRGRPMGLWCQPSKTAEGEATSWGTMEPASILGPQGWCNAAQPDAFCECYLDGGWVALWGGTALWYCRALWTFQGTATLQASVRLRHLGLLAPTAAAKRLSQCCCFQTCHLPRCRLWRAHL